ncbi:unnamed protein product, partial [Rotaria socialis]
TRAYESSDGGTPSSARFRSKRYCANETNENSPRRNKYHPYSAPVQFDENANEPFHDENHRYFNLFVYTYVFFQNSLLLH